MQLLRKKLTFACIQTDLLTDFFQTWYEDRDYLALHFEISLDELNLHSRSKLYKKSKTSVSIFSQI